MSGSGMSVAAGGGYVTATGFSVDDGDSGPTVGLTAGKPHPHSNKIKMLIRHWENGRTDVLPSCSSSAITIPCFTAHLDCPALAKNS
jgi:hypothetical protein